MTYGEMNAQTEFQLKKISFQIISTGNDIFLKLLFHSWRHNMSEQSQDLLFSNSKCRWNIHKSSYVMEILS